MAFKRRTEALTVRELEDGLVVLDIRANRIHQLNPTASFIWEECDTAGSVGEIAERVATAFSVKPADIQADVERTIGDLLAAELLEKS